MMDLSRGKSNKNNSKGDKGKKAKTDEVLPDLSDMYPDKFPSSSQGKGNQSSTGECSGKSWCDFHQTDGHNNQ